MNKEQARKEIEALMHDYAELQNTGAYLVLKVLLEYLGLDDELEKINNEEL